MQFQISSRKETREGDIWVIKIRVLREVFSKQLCFIRCRRQHLQAVEQRKYSRFIFVGNTISNSSKVPKTKFLGSDGLFSFTSICKFGSFKSPFALITSLSELYFRFRRFILLAAQMKKVISMNYGSSISIWKPWRWVRFDLIFTLKGVYTNSNLNPTTKFTSSSRNTEFKGILPWNISQTIAKTASSARE